MATKTKISKVEVTDGDYVRMYYEHQYDRVAKLETLRLSITNVVITLSVVSFTFSFSNNQSLNTSNQSLNIMSGVILPIILIVSNIFAIVYIALTLKIIRAHVNRAAIVLGQFASALSAINNKERPPKWTDKFNLAVNQIIFHILLIVLSSLPVWLYYHP